MEPTPEQVEAFKKAWHQADEEGRTGERVVAGLRAALAVGLPGFTKRYFLVGHPAWPDPLMIWPPTEENAARYHQKYVVEDDRPQAANARIVWWWEQQGSVDDWTPERQAPPALPLHRTEAGFPRCSTCDGGGCPDCTDPA